MVYSLWVDLAKRHHAHDSEAGKDPLIHLVFLPNFLELLVYHINFNLVCTRVRFIFIELSRAQRTELNF